MPGAHLGSAPVLLDKDYEVNHNLYTPSGKWEKTKHRSIDGWKTLMRIKGMAVELITLDTQLKLRLAVTPPLSLMLRKGVIAGGPFLGVTDPHRWNTSNIPRWKGFFSEVVVIPWVFGGKRTEIPMFVAVGPIRFLKAPPTTPRSGRTPHH